MGLVLNFEADQSTIDNTEAVSFASVATAGNTLVAIPDAGFYRTGSGVSEREDSDGVYQRFDATFSVRASLLAGVGGAKPADQITRADNTVWTVLRASPPVVSGIWQLTTISLAIAGALKVSGTLKRPVAGKDSAYRPALASYTNVAANVVCWVQQEDATAADLLGRRTMDVRLKAYLATSVTAQAKDQFICGGITYTVVKATKPSRLDALQELDLQQVS